MARPFLWGRSVIRLPLSSVDHLSDRFQLRHELVMLSFEFVPTRLLFLDKLLHSFAGGNIAVDVGHGRPDRKYD
ncbi:MAG: hypothetical protein OXF02_06500 [Simkaniaceae bacterium]|nr:hypothetical protein [Simkaniaceae bacterium]